MIIKLTMVDSDDQFMLVNVDTIHVCIPTNEGTTEVITSACSFEVEEDCNEIYDLLTLKNPLMIQETAMMKEFFRKYKEHFAEVLSFFVIANILAVNALLWVWGSPLFAQ